MKKMTREHTLEPLRNALRIARTAIRGLCPSICGHDAVIVPYSASTGVACRS